MPAPLSIQEHFKQHLLLAYPIMISQLSHIAMAVADNVMVGWLGATPLAASALANSILWPFLMLGLGISYGLTPLVAAADAKKQYSKATKALQHSLVINLAFGCVFCGVICLGSPLLHHMGQTPAVADLAKPYLWIVAGSFIPLMLFQAFREYTEGLSFTREAMYINLFCSLVNILLNYVLIYGQLGFPAMGLNGAAWATLASRILMALMMGGCIFRLPKLGHHMANFRWQGFMCSYFVKLLQIGGPAGVELALESMAYTACVVMAGWIGVETQAAHMIAVNLGSISWIVVLGIALATTIRVGNQWGVRDFAALRTAGFVGFTIGSVFMLLASVVFLWGHQVLPSFYTHEVVVLNIASPLLILVGLLQLPDGIGAVGVAASRGMEDTKVPFIIATIGYWLLGVPLGYLFCFQLAWGIQGLWWGLNVGRLVGAIALLLRFHYTSRRLVLLHEQGDTTTDIG
ncbi:MAG: MATE family efflux transporter [Roseivirga sp.]